MLGRALQDTLLWTEGTRFLPSELTTWKDKGKWCLRGYHWCQCRDRGIKDGYTVTVILEQRLRLPKTSLCPHIQLQKERLTTKAAERQGTQNHQAQDSRNMVKSLVGPYSRGIQPGGICSSQTWVAATGGPLLRAGQDIRRENWFAPA